MLNQFTEVECREYFRFTQAEVRQILPYLGLDEIVYRQRRTATSELAFCLLLSRLSSNKRFKDDLSLFARNAKGARVDTRVVEGAGVRCIPGWMHVLKAVGVNDAGLRQLKVVAGLVSMLT